MAFKFETKKAVKAAVILPEDIAPPEIKKHVPPPPPITLSECLRKEMSEEKTALIARRLIEIATDSEGRTSDSLTAIKTIFERMEGAPKSTVDLNVTANPLSTMTREQLRQYLATQGLAAVSTDAVLEIENIAQEEANQ